MAKKDLEGIVNSETKHNPSSEISTKKYLGWKLAGHGLGAVFSIGGSYFLEKILGYGRFFTSFVSQAKDYIGDQLGFNIARSFSERKKKIYQGFSGFGRYVKHSVGYAVRHLPGALAGMGIAGAATYAISALFQLPVYLAIAVPRAAEITTEIALSTHLTKGYRRQLAQLPAYSK